MEIPPIGEDETFREWLDRVRPLVRHADADNNYGENTPKTWSGQSEMIMRFKKLVESLGAPVVVTIQRPTVVRRPLSAEFMGIEPPFAPTFLRRSAWVSTPPSSS